MIMKLCTEDLYYKGSLFVVKKFEYLYQISDFQNFWKIWLILKSRSLLNEIRFFDSIFRFWKLKHCSLHKSQLKLGTDLGQKLSFFKISDNVIRNYVMTFFWTNFEYFSKGLSKALYQSKLECHTIIISKVITNF